MSRIDWTDEENDLIVADYFAMLRADLSGRKYVKAQHNRLLQEQTGRARGSIEFKHRNISAVLKGLGEPWIDGYKPAFKFQDSLVEAVARHLARGGEAELDSARSAGAHSEILFEPAPTIRNAPPPAEAEQMDAIARKFDVALRQEANRVLGRAGEECVLHHERQSLARAGRADLAEAVRWVSDLDGDGAGYDIHSFSTAGVPRLIEVKTTNGWERTPFHISRNELDVSERRRAEWCLFRVFNFARRPRAFEIRPPLEAHVALVATSFRAEFRQRL